MRFLASLLFVCAFLAFSLPAFARSSGGASWHSLNYVQTIIPSAWATNQTTFYSTAEGSQGSQYAFYSTDSGATIDSLSVESDAAIMFSIVMGSDQVGITTGMGIVKSPNSYTTDGYTFKIAPPISFVQTVQSAQLVQDNVPNGYGLAGSFGNVNGVAVSQNGGKTYKTSNCQSVSGARYAAFPTSQVWFVTAGQWPNNSNIVNEKNEYELSHRIKLKTKAATMARLPIDMTNVAMHEGAPIKPPGINDFFAQVMRTTDGGATWESVFLNRTFYPNDIRMADANTGFFVGSGNGISFIYGTKDGGNTWQVLYTGYSSDMFAAWMTSPTEWWVGGADLESGGAASWFSNDAGQSWTKTDIAGAGELMSISMVDSTHGYASAITQEQVCTLLAYHP